MTKENSEEITRREALNRAVFGLVWTIGSIIVFGGVLGLEDCIDKREKGEKREQKRRKEKEYSDKEVYLPGKVVAEGYDSLTPAEKKDYDLIVFIRRAQEQSQHQRLINDRTIPYPIDNYNTPSARDYFSK